MKMKFRKLIAAVCAGCMLVSNISFADLPEETLPESVDQSTAQQTDELTPSEGVQPETSLSEPKLQPEDQSVIPENQQETPSQEQEHQAEDQPDVPDEQPAGETQAQPAKPETPTEQQPKEATNQTEQQSAEPKTQTPKQPEISTEQDPAEKNDEAETVHTLEAGKVLSGTLKSDEEYKARLIPEWDLELIFTLKVPSSFLL